MNGRQAILLCVVAVVGFSSFAFVLLRDWKRDRRVLSLAGGVLFALAATHLTAEFLSCARMISLLRELHVDEVVEIDIGGRTITDRGSVQPLVEGLNDCHWFFPTHGAGAERMDFWLRLRSGRSYGFFVANEYGKQAILIFTEPGKGLKASRGYAGSARLLRAMRELGI